MKNIIDDLKRNIENLQDENRNSEMKHVNCYETVARLHDDIDLKNQEVSEQFSMTMPYRNSLLTFQR